VRKVHLLKSIHLRVHLPRRLKSSYIRQRLVTAVLVYLVVYILNFLIPHLQPGSYVSTLSNSSLEPAARARLMEQFGINQPLWEQFLKYVQQTFLSFPPNYGPSFSRYPLSVWTIVSAALPWTLLLIIVSQTVAWVGGILLGAWVAWKRGSKTDSFVVGVSTFMWGVPSYWLATILIYVLAIKLHFFPPALVGSYTGVNSIQQVLDILSHAFLPILTLVLLNLPLNAMVMRNTMVNVLQEDFMIAATARGLKGRTLILGHAARNALLPTMTSLALSFGTVLSGAYLTEIIYSYPGMGSLITQAVFARDYPVLQAVFFFSALLVIVANLLADVTYIFLDPRVEL
jgi:peptide/nickel transport system permease protein